MSDPIDPYQVHIGGVKADPRPSHYAKPVMPWDLQEHMESSGDVFIDARRTDIIEYAFRIKGTKEDQRRDLEKIICNATAAIQRADKLTSDLTPAL